MPVSEAVFRSVAGAFPTGVAVVTAVDRSGAPKGFTSQAFIGLSIDPPLVLVSVDRTSRTLAALHDSGAFVVNMLREGAQDISALFASKSDDKFRDLPWRPSSCAGGAPILDTVSLAYAECVITHKLEFGDHWVLVGSVEGGGILEGAPLMYFRRQYGTWPT